MASVFVALPHSQVRSIRHQDRRGCVWWSAWLLKHLLPGSFARNLEPDAETRRCLMILEFHSICASCFWIQVSLDADKPPSWSFEEVSKWERFCEGRMNRIYTGIYKPIAAYGCIMDLEGRQMSCESSESESKTWNPEQASGMNRVFNSGV